MFRLLILLCFTLFVNYSFSQKEKKTVRINVDSNPLINVQDNSILLYDKWKMRESYYCGTNGNLISTIDYDTKEWYPTTIPNTVLGVLVDNNIYPDPYIGLNNMKIPDASDEVNDKYNLKQFSHLPDKENPWKKPYWFRTEFKIPKNFKDKIITLNINGLNYKADIWINGKLIEKSDKIIGMFKRFQFNITDKINKNKNNALAICIYPLDYPGNQFRAPLDGPYGPLGGPGGDGEILRNVTQYSTIGWDWIPSVRDRNIGIWQHVYLSASNDIRVYDPAAFTEIEFPDTTKSNITLKCIVENFNKNEKEFNLKFEISPVGFKDDTIKFEKSYTLSGLKKEEITVSYKDVASLIMKNPKLWWPRNYGNQYLYKLSVSAICDNKISSKAEKNFGVRTVGTCVLPSGGRAFTVNNRIIRFNGGAWVPDFMLTWSAKRYIDEVRLMAESNHSIVRINGCGIIVPDVFLDACDKYGLLVWQELSRTSVEASSKKESSKTWTPPYVNPDIYLDNIKDCILRMRSHPSLIIWCGSNEAAPQSDIGIALQNKILPELDDSRVWLPASAETPEWSNIETRGWTGGPWDIKPMNDYYKMYSQNKEFTFKNEIGLASPPNINSIKYVIPDFDKPTEEWFPFNKEISYHDAAGFTLYSLNKLIEYSFGKSSSLNEYLWMANIFNNMAYRTIFEAANKARPLNAGTMLWKSNAAWHSFNWQVFDWNLKQNAGFYSMLSACKPVHVQASSDDMTIQVSSILNYDLLDLKIRTRIFSAKGELQDCTVKDISVKRDALTLAGSLNNIVNDGNLHFISMELFKDNDIIDKTDIWIQKNGNWNELMKMETACIDIYDINIKEDNKEVIYSFYAHNKSQIPGVNISMSILNALQGEEILPAFWNNNEFTIMPGDKKYFEVKIEKSLLKNNNNIHLNVEGLNIIPFTVDINKKKYTELEMYVKNIDIENSEKGIKITTECKQKHKTGSRINNWVLPVYIDNVLYRNILVGIGPDKSSYNTLIINDIAKGKHKIKINNIVKEFIVK